MVAQGEKIRAQPGRWAGVWNKGRVAQFYFRAL
jgi:hypothetical protein